MEIRYILVKQNTIDDIHSKYPRIYENRQQQRAKVVSIKKAEYSKEL